MNVSIDKQRVEYCGQVLSLRKPQNKCKLLVELEKVVVNRISFSEVTSRSFMSFLLLRPGKLTLLLSRTRVSAIKGGDWKINRRAWVGHTKGCPLPMESLWLITAKSREQNLVSSVPSNWWVLFSQCFEDIQIPTRPISHLETTVYLEMGQTRRGFSETNPWRNTFSIPLNKEKVEVREESRRKLISECKK